MAYGRPFSIVRYFSLMNWILRSTVCAWPPDDTISSSMVLSAKILATCAVFIAGSLSDRTHLMRKPCSRVLVTAVSRASHWVRDQAFIYTNILTTVAFLATRQADQDDLGKLRRVLRYLSNTREGGLCLRPGLLGTTVRAYIDAAYGVHSDCKSHTGSAIVIGDAGPVFARSGTIGNRR
jgi:hypothetical protein